MQVARVSEITMVALAGATVCQHRGPAARGTTAHDAQHHEGANYALLFMPSISCRFAWMVGTPGACAIAPKERTGRGGARHQRPHGKENQSVAKERQVSPRCCALLCHLRRSTASSRRLLRSLRSQLVSERCLLAPAP